MTHPAITQALDYLKGRGYPLTPDVLSVLPREALSRDHQRELAGGIKAGVTHSRALKSAEYQVVRDAFWSTVYEAVQLYLSVGGSIVEYRNQMRRAVADAWNSTLDIAYADGGGSLPVDDATLERAGMEQASQLEYVNSFFATLRDLKKEGEYDDIAEAFAAAERWSMSLDGFYNLIKLAGASNKMYTWYLGGAERHCATCLKLNGQRHKASWYISRNYIPRKPGSATDCGGFHCDCGLWSDDGQEFSI